MEVIKVKEWAPNWFGCIHIEKIFVTKPFLNENLTEYKNELIKKETRALKKKGKNVKIKESVVSVLNV